MNAMGFGCQKYQKTKNDMAKQSPRLLVTDLYGELNPEQRIVSFII